MTYEESSRSISRIRYRDEMLFRMAVSHLMDVGIRHLTEEAVRETCAGIMKQDDTSNIMSNEYLCRIVRTAAELAEIDPVHLLHYISMEVDYFVGDQAISYKRAIRLLRECLNWMYEDTGCVSGTLKKAKEIGFDRTELEKIGMGFLTDVDDGEEDGYDQ